MSVPAEIAGTPRARTRRPRAWRRLLATAGMLVSLEMLARVLAPEPQLGILAQRPLLGLYAGLDRPDEVFSDLDHSCLQWSPYEHWTMRPNLGRRFFRTNALGLRGPETARVKSPERFRIAVLGGSSAWGVGSTGDERTVPGQIEARLRELLPGTDVEVLNAAQPGFVSAQELIHFHRSIATLEPDLVLLFDGYNDVVADLGNPVPGWPQGARHLQMRYEDFIRSGRFGADLLLLLRSSRAFDLAFSRMAAPPPAVPPPSVPAEETARCYVRNAVALKRLVAPRPVWVALQPVIATTRKPLAPEEQGVLADRERQTPGYAGRVRATYRTMTKDLEGAVPSIDLEDALGPEPRLLFADDCHFGDEAARLIGRRIAERLHDAHTIPDAPPAGASTAAAPPRPAAAASRFEQNVAAYEASDRTDPPPQGAILLAGDSQFFRWKTPHEDLPGYTIVNRGIDSLQLSDLVHFADRLVLSYKPRLIVLHVGGNDVHNGKGPEQVLADFKEFVARVRARLPDTPIVFSSITPGPGRWDEADRRRQTNRTIKDYVATQPALRFLDLWDAMLTPDGKPREDLWVEDRVHPNHAGYLVRVKAMLPMLGKPDRDAQ